MNDPSMANNDQLQQLSQRAERLFAKNSYAAAKKEFERIVELSPSEDVRRKLRICEQELVLQQRKEQIKKGRRWEKKGELASALDCFTSAATAQTEPWLEDKITQLRQQLETSKAISAVEKAAREKDPEKRLATYDLALAQGQDPALAEKRIGCLVEMGRHEEAIELYGNEAPQSIQGRYDFGYALIARGRYREGLMQWEPLLPDYPVLFPQVMAFLPCLARELARQGKGYAAPYGVLSDPRMLALEKKGSSEIAPEAIESLDQYRRYFRYCYLKELWRADDYAGLLELLPSPPGLPDVPLLARLYLNLAETDINYLKAAITYWLTAVYWEGPYSAPNSERSSLDDRTSQQDLLDALSVDGLLAPLEAQIAAHTRSGRFTPDLQAHWQTERRQIRHLAEFLAQSNEESPSVGGEASDDDEKYLLCTPAFAREFGLSDQILDLLRAKKDNTDDDAVRLELHAGFSPLGACMDWIEPGTEEKVFHALPNGKSLDPETRYLCQRVALRCGINRIRAGGRHTRKFFQAALPVLGTAPRLPQELIDLAYAQPTEQVISSLSEAMEFLARHVKEPRFLEATAHCIGLDLQNLLLQGVSSDILEKRLAVGLSFDPDCQQLQTIRELILKEKNSRKIGKALRSGNLQKAARIVRDIEDPELSNLFFDTMETFYHEIPMETEEREINALINRLYEACCIADEEHWLTEELAEERLARELV
uniref:Tetratricopeptide repeat-containing protein n=1 Tax=Candidatus Kentrum sp. MB TaxID=2138164 RepID=A0A450XUC4_9GAMM|nr:MAG: hypothetical protein BECKMB1821G_GA0114241_103723 [Candidatus Kentron sp. MB]VFK32872.1 MAG: hypothetical protein BECKMB1821I_GA0114274_103721 [Candidatus Kentron sp. MB]VFK75927.1 MAG: hypothetical protein BECKMB1821H_GA0114242_10366 [Candidatus Kentron sp. MB]